MEQHIDTAKLVEEFPKVMCSAMKSSPQQARASAPTAPITRDAWSWVNSDSDDRGSYLYLGDQRKQWLNLEEQTMQGNSTGKMKNAIDELTNSHQ